MESTGTQPGQTVSPTPPGGAAPKDPEPPRPPAPEPAPEPPATPEPPTPEEQSATAEPPQSFDTTQPESKQDDSQSPDAQSITWTASEFIAHSKSFGWYAGLALAAIMAAALIFYLTKDRISAAVILGAAFLLGIYGGHKPRELQYQLDQRGLTIGSRHFTYDHFRCFSVLPEGAFSSIVFMPLKRFAVTTTIYYAPEDEDKIVSLLGTHLPLEERGHDAIDRLMHRIHF
jgi:hypothetical protein